MNRFLTAALTLLVALSGCASRPRYTAPPSGHVFRVDDANGNPLFTVVDSHSVESYQAAFEQAKPLANEMSFETKPDFIFTEFLDGRILNEYSLYRGGEINAYGFPYLVDARWHYHWRIKYDQVHAAEFLKQGEPAETDTSSASTENTNGHVFVPEADSQIWGKYLRTTNRSIQARWEKLMINRAVYPKSGTVVRVSFTLLDTGEIDEITADGDAAGKKARELCIDAVKEGAPYARWTPEMIAAWGHSKTLHFVFHH